MNRVALAIVIVALLGAANGAAFEAGGGVAVLVPESLYISGQGSVSVQTALGTGVGINRFASIPIRVAYNQVYGLMPAGDAYSDADAPWFYGDSVLADVQLKLRVPISTFYLDVFGGGAANWLATLRPLTKNIENTIAETLSGIERISFDNLTYSSGLGFGWLVGAGFGITIDTISVDLSGTFLTVEHPLTLSGSYYELPAGGTPVPYDPPSDPGLRLRGIMVGLRGSIRL